MPVIHEPEESNWYVRNMPVYPEAPVSVLATLTLGQILAVRRYRSQYAGLAHCILITGYFLSRRPPQCAIERVIIRAAEELCRISTPATRDDMMARTQGVQSR